VSKYTRAISYAKTLTKSLVRRRVTVKFDDLSRRRPVSDRFGDDRGMPIDRYYVERFLGVHAKLITGDVMEIGGSRYATMFGTHVDSIAVLHATSENPEATIVGDLTDPSTLPEAAIDCLICTQTLGFIFDVERAIEGIARVLRPGGVLLATVGGISQISRYDMDRWGDYWRFTDASLRQLFARFGSDVKIETYGNVSAAVAFLQGVAVEDLPDRMVLDHHDADYQVVLSVIARRPTP
jgi:SAM-dependent methyltransferase